MCLAILKPVGTKLPERKLLSNGFSNNPDGSGIAWWQPSEKQVHIVKGMMTEQALFQELDKLKNLKDKLMLIHFRQATAGKICPENCHPFPVTAEDKLLQQTKLDTNTAVVHNGIIVDYANDDNPQWYEDAAYAGISYYLGDNLTDKLSDTQRFVRDYMAPLKEKIWDTTVQKLLLNYTDSKLAWIDNQGKSALLGKFIEHKGSYYSNNGYSYCSTRQKIDYTKPNQFSKSNVRYLPAQMEVGGKPVNDATDAADMFECEMCGEWTYEEELIEYEDMTMCRDCFNCITQGMPRKLIKQYPSKRWEAV